MPTVPTHQTTLFLTTDGKLALDYKPNGYAFLNFPKKAPKWTFIKSQTVSNAFSIRPVDNIDFAITLDENRNALVVKPASVNSRAIQLWSINEKEVLISVQNSQKQFDIDKIALEGIEARAYLTSPNGPGDLTDSDEEVGEDNDTLYGKSVSNVGAENKYGQPIYPVNITSSRQNKKRTENIFKRKPSPSNIIENYSIPEDSVVDHHRPVFSRNASEANSTVSLSKSEFSSILKRRINKLENSRLKARTPLPRPRPRSAGSYASNNSSLRSFKRPPFRSTRSMTPSELEDYEFERVLTKNFNDLKSMEKLRKKKVARIQRQQAIVNQKLAEFENKKSAEALFWIKAFERLNPNGDEITNVRRAGSQVRSLSDVMDKISVIKVPRDKDDISTIIEEVLEEKKEDGDEVESVIEITNQEPPQTTPLHQGKAPVKMPGLTPSTKNSTIGLPKNPNNPIPLARTQKSNTEMEKLNQSLTNLKMAHENNQNTSARRIAQNRQNSYDDLGSTVVDQRSFYGGNIQTAAKHWDKVHRFHLDQANQSKKKFQQQAIMDLEAQIKKLERSMQ